MLEKGVKKTTVDELVKRAGIPKGTFYLFYPSKEMLLFDASQDFHAQVDSYITAGVFKIIKDKNLSMSELNFSDCVEELTDVILGAMEITYNSCLKVLLIPESMNLILSKIPDEVLENHRKDDSGVGDGLFQGLATKNGLSVEAVVSGIVTTLLVVAISSNKVEEMAVGKLSGLFGMVLFVPYAITGTIKYVFFMFPMFWIGEWSLYGGWEKLIVAFVEFIVWIYILFLKFKKKMEYR